MYGKIFESIYDGTLRVNWQALVTFQQLIILADKDGIVDMTPYAIHGRTGIPLEIINVGLKHLSEPDPHSRSNVEGGRRLTPLDPHRNWGWRLVNHSYYSGLRSAEEKREADRKRIADKRAQQHIKEPGVSQSVAVCSETSQDVADVAPVDVTVTIEPLSATNVADVETTVSTVPFDQIVNLYHKILPELPKCLKLTKQRKGNIRQRWIEDLPDLGSWKTFFGFVRQSKFLMGRAPPRNGREPFRATLDWLCKPENAVKVVERKYG